MATLEESLQASRKPQEVSQPSTSQRMTRGVNISSSYASLLSKSIRHAKAMEGENSQPQDVKV